MVAHCAAHISDTVRYGTCIIAFDHRSSSRVMCKPQLAVGVPSGSGIAHARRRAAIRASWLKFDEFRSGIAVGVFVVRCAANETASSALRAEAARHPNDTLCSPLGQGCSSNACRTRGVVLALIYWLRHTLTALPSVRWIAKADDDVFINIPRIIAYLDAIPTAIAPWAFFGTPGFFSTLENETMLIPRGYAPSYQFALKVARRYALRRQCGELTRSRSCRIVGPFPYMCGQFFALGAGIVRAVVLQRTDLGEEERRIARLPDSNPLVTEDVWLGSLLFRFLDARGQPPRASNRANAQLSTTAGERSAWLRRPQLALFSLEGQRGLWLDPTHAKADKLRVPSTLIVYHNRLRVHRWMTRLYDFATVLQRCATPLRWQPRWPYAIEGAGSRGVWDPGWTVYSLVPSGASRPLELDTACIPSTVDLLDPQNHN